MLKSIASASVISLVMAFSANADINTSLQQVCDNAKQQHKAALASAEHASVNTYQSKLASFYAGVSCQGKSLIHTSLKDSKKSTERLADRYRQDRF